MIPTKLMGSDKDLKVLENSATVFNLALVVFISSDCIGEEDCGLYLAQ